MSADNTNNQADNPNPEQGKPFPGRFVFEYDKQPIYDLVGAIKEQTSEHKKEKNNSENVRESEISNQKVTRDIYKRANTISVWAVSINTFIFLATLGVFIYNIHGVNAATKSANVADSTYNEIKKQFAIENRPIIQASSLSVSPLVVGNHIGIDYAIENYGKQPAKLLSTRSAPVFSTLSDFNDFGYLPQDVNKINIKLAGGTHVPLSLVSNVPLPIGQRDSLVSGKLYIYLMGELTYINTITDSTIVYDFNYRISMYPRFSVMFITDDEK